MVLHPPPHPLERRDDGDAVAGELGRGPDPRAQQRGRGGVGAEGDDHRVGLEGLGAAGPDQLDPVGAAAADAHAVDQHPGAQLRLGRARAGSR